MLAIVIAASGALNMPCAELKNIELERATITSAVDVAAGLFKPPNPPPNPQAQSGPPPQPVPQHCRVTLVLKPTPDSNINAELWLPTENWNGKFLAVGNGGWAGSIQGYGDMQAALRRGYATAATDTGHSAADGPNGMFALGHPEKIVDFAYRALHDMTVKSKRLIDVFYAAPLDYSYYKGCSTGGRMGVMAAQRFPGDYDGIIAGALANRHIHMHTAGSYRSIELARHPDEALSEAKAKLVNDAVMKKCDTLGEGFLNNPRQCSFDFDKLACPAGSSSDSCLSPGELKSVHTFYEGLHTSDGQLVFSGQNIGNPIPALVSRPEGPGENLTDSIKILGFQNANYDWRQFDLDRDLPIIDARTGFVDAVDPDLRAFKAHGGKLLLYAGWRDTGITPENTVYYYENVREEMRGDPGQAGQDDWMRLFMVPGMGHCRGGPGVDTFDTLGAIEQWRERDVAPAEMPATNRETGLSRPLCAYPKYAKYDGSGDLKDAANWSCSAE
ncbi:MAG TPA: tannase/feruloyl esterase family alpha/beta hydrolase [Gammaproteobacteria bacterium]|nr:tannase/feruloyl esterase family alpha/beta hydrolase [Gammaproteobacteria bacterium]